MDIRAQLVQNVVICGGTVLAFKKKNGEIPASYLANG